MADELKLVITVKESTEGSYVEVISSKPNGMSTAEFIGYIEMAKQDIIRDSTLIKEH